MTYTKADGTSLGNLGYTPDGELDKVAVLPHTISSFTPNLHYIRQTIYFIKNLT